MQGGLSIDAAFIGLIAGFLTTGSQVPQALKVHNTGSTDDLSTWWLLALLMGTITWLYYGVMINDLPLIIWNLISVFTVGYITACKFKIIKTKTDSTSIEMRKEFYQGVYRN